MLADGHALPNQTQLRPPPSWPSGVEVTAVCYDGMIHAFGPLNALCQVPGMRSALLHASEELRKRLGGRAASAIVPDLRAAGLLMRAGYSAVFRVLRWVGCSFSHSRIDPYTRAVSGHTLQSRGDR